jgi:hypothetical protein
MFDEMPAEVRRVVNRLSAEYGIDPFVSFKAMRGIVGKIMPGNLCAGCGEMIEGASAGLYAVVVEPSGSVVGSICCPCVERFKTDEQFALRIDSEGYRAVHGAGPDDVGGHA